MNFHEDLSAQSFTPQDKWFQTFKAENQNLLEKAEIPNRRTETWKYTNLASFLKEDFKIKSTASPKSLISDEPGFTNIHIQHGHLNQQTFQGLLDLGAECTPLTHINSDEIKDLLTGDAFFKNDYINLVNNSYLNNAWVIKFNKNFKSQNPVILNHYIGEKHAHLCSQLFIVLEDNVQVNLLENFNSQDESTLFNYKSHIKLAPGSHLCHVLNQHLGLADHFIYSLNSHIDRDAHYNSCIINQGARLSRSNLYVNLHATGATADVHGLYQLKENQHHDTMSFIHHNCEHTYSHQLYKGILSDSSRGIFTGRVRVEKNAQQINAEQLNKNLLLSKKAHTNSRPQMEIYADDVKCAHGSTTGQISEEEMFYFTSRGITPEKAHKMLAQAYTNDVLLKINNLKIRSYMQSHLEKMDF
ncbi:MAG: Fe-S cluster assembly protein SufD [Halobacteriovoraceae bacterium]|nr:Fe-S cluster assembly protein SufD [Halobacteriovoraceae bacterium]|tara:strand:+ start:14409 stop:15650 length:1242 start_codon:yes stop_codon:yes gene_type:complete